MKCARKYLIRFYGVDPVLLSLRTIGAQVPDTVSDTDVESAQVELVYLCVCEGGVA